MNEICLYFPTGSSVVFQAGRSHGDGIAKSIDAEWNDEGAIVTIVDDDGTERIFPDACILWYVNEAPPNLEVV